MFIIDIAREGDDSKKQQLGSRKYLVIIEGQPNYRLYRSDIKSLELQVGQEVDETIISKINEILYKRGLKYCYHLIGKKDYTCGQIRKKLATGLYPDRIIEEVVLRLQELSLLDDQGYAKRFIETYESTKSFKWMEQKLYQKGIRLSDYNFERADVNEQQALSKASRQWFRRQGLRMDQLTDVSFDHQKLKSFLYRKGFSIGSINDLLDKIG